VVRIPPFAVLIVAAIVGSCACQTRVRGSRETSLHEAREATATAWVNALGGGPGDDERLRQLTAGVLIYRTTGENDSASCEGQVSSDVAAFAAWLSCVRAKPYLRGLSDAMKVYREALRADSDRNAALAQYLPRVVGGSDAWSRYVGANEQRRAARTFDALKKEAGREGEWTTIAASWLYTTAVFRVQVVGGADTPRVHAVMVDVARTSD
jgi:hypothetical protein